MNKKTRNILAVAACAAIILAIILAINVRNSSVQADGLVLTGNGKTVTIDFTKLNETSFSGQIMNGKGESADYEYKGAELSALLQANGIEVNENSRLEAASEDNYTAEISGQEILTSGKVYVAIEANGKMIEGIDGGQGAQLVIFGDPNSKRQVRYLKMIKVE